MPIFVRNFSEGMIPDDTRELYNLMLAEWYESKLHNLYVTSQNVRFRGQSGKQSSSELKELEKLEINVKAFIERMVDKYQDEKLHENTESPGSAFSSSLSDEEEEESNEPKSVAEMMFSNSTPTLPSNVGRDNNSINELRNTLEIPKNSWKKVKSKKAKKEKREEDPSQHNWNELHQAYL